MYLGPRASACLVPDQNPEGVRLATGTQLQPHGELALTHLGAGTPALLGPLV